ncbi:MAG TPA: amidophosphoribosyltransferase [Chthonomonas sp.]|uniref:amidophosphoribosyltransferase n=1 Tax=Chthonomonas sp. TaxID=2282153 RepID=UPI002B4B0EE4|nr:amidophosphoribosyltransferase [Chthonomonas sp.]HLI48559.1 amidophosphoribosyltransferase [Chthonomonas sp.]
MDNYLLKDGCNHHDTDSPKEECGIFGIYAPGEEVSRIAFFGLFALQHRGQESAGIAVSDGHSIRLHKEMGLVTQVFNEERIRALQGISAIGHTRYSTTGSSVLCNAQPLVGFSSCGPIAVAHNGNLINTSELRNELEAEGCNFETTNDSEVIAQLLARVYRGNIEAAMREVMGRIKGAYSLVVLTPEKLLGVRDPCGIRPLCLGRLGNGHYVIASESCALTTVGANYLREVEPGEIISIGQHGLQEIQAVPMQRRATCLLEFIYFARPDSMLYNRTLHTVRRRMGQELAREHPCPGAHVVIPIPDTGTPAALGYAEVSRIPYGEGVIKSRYIQRTFIQPSQRMRDMGARMKYTPLKETLAGRKVVMVDDTIVRGTTTDKLVRMLFEAGAAEVHVRITAPPVKYPCFYGIDMADQDELVAARHSVEEIRQLIGATSLGYLSLQGVLRAIDMGRDNFCRACFDGKYPVPIPQQVKLTKMMLEEPVKRLAHVGTGPEESLLDLNDTEE